MTSDSASLGAAKPEGVPGASRVLGRVRGDRPGPTLICIAGMHGNEPAGIEALVRVFRTLAEQRPPLRGELIALTGNLSALAHGRRYIDRDLNRGWLPKGKEPATTERPAAEDREAGELISELEAVFDRTREPLFVLDIHTTSGEGVPFLTVHDTLRNRKFAKHFPVPIVLGIEEEMDGTLLDYLTNLGHVTVSVEAGQHDSAVAIDQAEAAVWIALVAAGLVEDDDLPPAGSARERLSRTARTLPRVLEVRHRHPVFPGDAFGMQRGFLNFDRIEPGQLLARDHSGEIRSRWQARILMPLYQEQGEDGFFIVREFHPFWLKISTWLRHLRASRIVHWLPGIKRHPERSDTLVVNRGVARWYALEILHLLGYRKKRAVGDVLLVGRRPHDLRPPPRPAAPPAPPAPPAG